MNETRKTFLPRILIGAEKSGGGKTTLVCALLSLLAKDGGQVFGFKCGPDYIDPMFHRQVLGTPLITWTAFSRIRPPFPIFLAVMDVRKGRKRVPLPFWKG